MITIIENKTDSAFIKRKKGELGRKYKPTHSASIELANHLSVFLLSLQSEIEALSLLESYCEQSPYSEHHPQRWAAIVQAMALFSYLKCSKGQEEESQRIKEKIAQYPIEPNSGLGGKKYLHRLNDSIESNMTEVCGATPMEKCIIHAEHYLAYIYAVVTKPDVCKVFEETSGKVIEDELRGLLIALNVELNTVK